MSALSFLNSKYDPDNTDLTWHNFLRLSLMELLREGEGFSGKRPLGDSGWDSYLEDQLSEHNTNIEAVVNTIFYGDKNDVNSTLGDAITIKNYFR
tara:strand:+ start:9492 stop:9776 length:285 start_codon:yes stop_codon:yes gene_type:complete